MTKTASVSFGSSRTIVSLGPPHPPEFKNIRIGLRSLFLKYSVSLSVANFVTSSIVSPLKNIYMTEQFQTFRKVCTIIGSVNIVDLDVLVCVVEGQLI